MTEGADVIFISNNRLNVSIWLVIFSSILTAYGLADIPNYQSVQNSFNLPQQPLDIAFRPLDLHGDQYVSIGPNGEIYLIDWRSNQRTQITDDGLKKGEAVLSEQYIAWTAQQEEIMVRDYPVALHDIFVQNRLTGEQKRITKTPAPRWQLAIDGSRLVWVDKRNELENHYTEYDIYAYDLATDTEYPIALAPGAQIHPSIHGELIVWQDNRNSPHRGTGRAGGENLAGNRYDIYIYDFLTQIGSAIVEEDAWLKSNPSVHNTHVVFEGYNGKNSPSNVYMLELETNVIHQLTQSLPDENNPILSDDRILWTITQACDVEVNRIGGDIPETEIPQPGVYIFDLNTRRLQRLTNYVQSSAFLDGRTVLIMESCWEIIEAYVVTLD